MNSVFFPVHVAVFLRRLVNIISTLSISNQYLLLKRANEDSISSHKACAEVTEWRWLTQHDSWRELEKFVRRIPVSGERLVKSNEPSMSWLGRGLTWNSLFSSMGGTGEDKNPPSRNTRSPTENIPSQHKPNDDTIHRLINSPVLYDPIRVPRYPIVLCHGLYGFDARGPSTFPGLRTHYWSNVLQILRGKIGAEVIITSVPGTGSITSRAESMDRLLREKARGRGVNFLAHSMGGLDCRHLISHIKPSEYAPLSLTTVSTPHRGSPFMDWCAENIGIGKLRQKGNSTNITNSEPSHSSPNTPKTETTFSLSLSSLPSSFTTLLISLLDSPAYANLTSHYLNAVFNPATPDDPHVKYFSVASRLHGVNIWHPFWLPKMILDSAEVKAKKNLADKGHRGWDREDMWGNDGLVTIQSARWGEFLGIIEGADHWEMRGARGIELNVDLASVSFSSVTATTGGGDGWSIKEWARFVGAWKKDERPAPSSTMATASSSQDNIELGTHVMDNRTKQAQERAYADAIIKSSTDKLSAVFDWIVEQVPPQLALKESKDNESGLTRVVPKDRPVTPRKNMNELSTKMDLERFYVALSRKLYDEGL